jgi:enterochelin esterase-like enzyme
MIGRWQELSLESRALQGNRLGDPPTRPLFVWTPPSYEGDPGRRYPAVYLLHAMTGQARSWFNVAPFTENVPAAVNRLGLETIVVLVDGWTAVGGSQWVDSPAIGRYGTYLCEDVVGFVDASFRTLAAPAHRGLAGHSSGGFGAMVWTLLRPDLFGGFASHAGDALFEVCFAPEFAAAAQALRNSYGGSFEAFWRDFRSGRPAFSRSTDALLQSLYATSAAFSPRDDGSFELPFRIETGVVEVDAWHRWLAWDPVRLARERAGVLQAARAIWIDAGRNDEYHLDLGATALHEAALEAGVRAEAMRFELYDGGHRGAGWRFALSLAHLAERLA